MVTKKKAAEQWPKHRSGKRCGYNEYQDGSISVAPTYTDSVTRARENQRAAEKLLEVVTNQCHAILKASVAEERRFWEHMVEDYSLDLEKYDYSFDFDHKMLRRTEKKAPALNE